LEKLKTIKVVAEWEAYKVSEGKKRILNDGEIFF